VGGVGVDEVEGPAVGRKVAVVRLALRPERVVGEHRDERLEVGGGRPAQLDDGVADGHGRGQVHAGSVAGRPQRRATRSVRARTCSHASRQASAHSPNARSKKECGAPS
jgi:hypothetical protein